MRRFALALIAMVVAAEAIAVPATAQTPSAVILVAAMKKVARIRANCTGGARSASGFVWPDASHVVTSRHVVAGCSQISMIFPGGASYTATPVRELRARDLVLLRLDRPTGLAPLRIADGIPPINSRVAAIGYALGAPSVDSKMLDVTIGNTPPGASLKDMLDDDSLRRIRQSGELDLATLILRLDGNLLPGLSGAPLIGSDGRVFGVGTGGLQAGAGGVVWAVRASYLRQLPQGSEVVSIQALQRSGLSFADQSPQDEVPEARCGDAVLHRSRTAALSTLFATADDAKGLWQLAMMFGGNFSDIARVEFEIWIDDVSGATIAIPTGAQLEGGAEMCSAHIDDGVDLYIRPAALPDQTVMGYNPSAEQEAGRFQSFLGSRFGVENAFFAPDPSFSYPTLALRGDGFGVRRLAFNGAHPATGDPAKAVLNYVFLTNMVRGQRYFGVSAVRRGMTVDIQTTQICMSQPALPQCVVGRQRFAGWSKAALAVHLATMPPI